MSEKNSKAKRKQNAAAKKNFSGASAARKKEYQIHSSSSSQTKKKKKNSSSKQTSQSSGSYEQNHAKAKTVEKSLEESCSPASTASSKTVIGPAAEAAVSQPESDIPAVNSLPNEAAGFSAVKEEQTPAEAAAHTAEQPAEKNNCQEIPVPKQDDKTKAAQTVKTAIETVIQQKNNLPQQEATAQPAPAPTAEAVSSASSASQSAADQKQVIVNQLHSFGKGAMQISKHLLTVGKTAMQKTGTALAKSKDKMQQSYQTHKAASESRKAEKQAKAAAAAEEKKQKKAEQAEQKKSDHADKKKKKPLVLRIVHCILWLLLFSIIAVGIGAYYYYHSLIKDCPELDLSKRNEYSVASTVYDQDGNLIAKYGTNENIEWVSIDEIPQTLQDAFVSIEDKRFYEHHGVDIQRTAGAIWGQLTHSNTYGGSTITQQLIKNTYLSRDVTYKRKAQEIHLALQIEKELSKDEILEWYMNTLFLGDSNYGVKVAAKDYFNKDLDQLTVRECAMIAGLAQAPATYDPRQNLLNGTLEITDERTNTVLYAMYTNGKLSEDQYQAALHEDDHIEEESPRYKLYDYPTYVEYAVENVATKLLQQAGTEVTDETLASEKIFLRSAGYNIYTAFNQNFQDITQDAITNFGKYPKAVDGIPVQASAVIMDQHTGRVVAMVGGLSEPTEPEGFNRATDSKQAVGSSMKPLSVYAPALDTGDYPGTTVMDTQTSIKGYGEDNSYPHGEFTNAAITMRRALELSHNIPACRFLLEHVGLDVSYNYLRSEGFEASDLAKTPAGLALGATDVTTLEMTAGYATLANDGVYIEPHAFTKVTDRTGSTVLDESCVETHRVFLASTSWLITDMMSTNMTEGLGVNARLKNVKSCGKTGTHEHQVISFGGYTPYYTSFLRISSDSYVNMINSSSYYQSAPLWKSYMDPISEGGDPDKEILDVTADELGIKKYHVCTNSGMLAKSDCPSADEYAAPNNQPTEICTGHSYGTAPEDNGDYSAYGYWDASGAWIGSGWWDSSGYHPQ